MASAAPSGRSEHGTPTARVTGSSVYACARRSVSAQQPKRTRPIRVRYASATTWCPDLRNGGAWHERRPTERRGSSLSERPGAPGHAETLYSRIRFRLRTTESNRSETRTAATESASRSRPAAGKRASARSFGAVGWAECGQRFRSTPFRSNRSHRKSSLSGEKWRRRESNPRPRPYRPSVYKLRLPLNFARRPVDNRPTDGLAILSCRASGDWLSLGAEPVIWRRYPSHGPNSERRRYLTRLGGECEIVLRTCFVSRWIYEADRGPRLAARPENRPRRNLIAPVCVFALL